MYGLYRASRGIKQCCTCMCTILERTITVPIVYLAGILPGICEWISVESLYIFHVTRHAHAAAEQCM